MRNKLVLTECKAEHVGGIVHHHMLSCNRGWAEVSLGRESGTNQVRPWMQREPWMASQPGIKWNMLVLSVIFQLEYVLFATCNKAQFVLYRSLGCSDCLASNVNSHFSDSMFGENPSTY